MAISLGANSNLIKIGDQVNKASNSLNRTFQRLSSGQRIVGPGDDAAGLAIADSLRLTTRLAQVAIRNANDGVSAVSIADGAMAEIQSILQRQSELAQQAANGLYTAAQRSVLASEFTTLASEVERIAVTAEFNGVALLSGASSMTLQIGFDSLSTSQLTIQNVQATLQALNLAAAGTSALTYSLSGATVTESQSAARNALTATLAALDSLSAKRGTLGTAESRLSAQLATLAVKRENYIAAESRIRDADVAEEAANLTRFMILQQAGISILAQANQSQRVALSLLQ
ncbi:MAG: flagellin [Pseudomonadota bacterium]|jgi:flagellin